MGKSSWDGRKITGGEASSSVVFKRTCPPPAKQESTAEWNGFRYAMCTESMQGMKWTEQCELLAKAGYRGIEIAPFSLVQEGD